jgi:hypothetical protein
METHWQDLSYGLFQLAKHPGFTAVGMLSLAKGGSAGCTEG